ncbi:MAG: VCBS repeat-containing protein, partial [bacterium]|nr:VCBS repeat-containing protein [bacterium]
MKNFFLSLFYLGLFSILAFPVTFDLPTYLPGIMYGSIVFGDIDNDGDLDLILAGSTGSDRFSGIYQNNGTGSFSEINAGTLTAVSYSSIALGDIDNDGDLDLVLTGVSNLGAISKIYQNDGTGLFTEINPGILTGVSSSSIALGDIDNDGDLDLILTGGPGKNSMIYQNDGLGNFIEINPNSL